MPRASTQGPTPESSGRVNTTRTPAVSSTRSVRSATSTAARSAVNADEQAARDKAEQDKAEQARAAKAELGESTVGSRVSIGPNGEGGFQLSVVLEVVIPDLPHDEAQALADQAHQVCPYSNATRGNIDVEVVVTDD